MYNCYANETDRFSCVRDSNNELETCQVVFTFSDNGESKKPLVLIMHLKLLIKKVCLKS